jgi:hypothetical protein
VHHDQHDSPASPPDVAAAFDASLADPTIGIPLSQKTPVLQANRLGASGLPNGAAPVAG